MCDMDLVKSNMLIHGHDTNVEPLKLETKLIDLAILLAIGDEYDKTGFKLQKVKSRIALKDSKQFLKDTFVLHKIPYCDEILLRLRLNGRILRDEDELVKLYNQCGININPLRLPVKYADEPYYHGKLSLLTNLGDDELFLKNMRVFFKGIELSKKTTQMTGICYVHEIVHTQLERLKGIVKDYYNSEVLTIFAEFVFAERMSPVLLKEDLKNRVNLFLMEFDYLVKYFTLNSSREEDKFRRIVAGKYVVSTLISFNLFRMYYEEDEIGRKYILSLVQDVFDGKYSLEDMLVKVGITYDNSLDKEHVLRLIK